MKSKTGGLKVFGVAPVMMVTTILLIVVFQVYWINKLYKDEWNGLKKETDVIFRETVYKLQVAKFKKDTLMFREFSGDNLFNIDAVRILNRKMRDTADREKKKATILINLEDRDAPRGTARRTFIRTADSAGMSTLPPMNSGGLKDDEPLRILEGKSLNDSLPVPQIDSAYKRELQRAGIKIPFTVTKTTGKTADVIPAANELKTNRASVGLMGAYSYQAVFSSPNRFIFKKIILQIAFSIMLIAFTLISFIILYRNLLAQKRLTAIKNSFISNITHELKTPISTVNVAIEALQKFGGIQNPERTKEYLDISASELQRLSLLVDKVLRLSMFESNKISLQKEPFSLFKLAQEVVASMRLQFVHHNAAVDVSTTGENFIIEADKLHIASVIYNLLDNALKYSTTSPCIGVSVIDQRQYIELRVSDNGIGISGEYRSKVFEQFFRVPNADKHNIKGYGLGLSYVNHIIKRHQGFIEVLSEPGEGSTFIIKLPFKEAPVIYYDRNRKVIKRELSLNALFKNSNKL